jgi:hypothetical protein
VVAHYEVGRGTTMKNEMEHIRFKAGQRVSVHGQSGLVMSVARWPWVDVQLDDGTEGRVDESIVHRWFQEVPRARMRIVKAAFRDCCKRCGRQFEVGEDVVWRAGGSGLTHKNADCSYRPWERALSGPVKVLMDTRSVA